MLKKNSKCFNVKIDLLKLLGQNQINFQAIFYYFFSFSSKKSYYWIHVQYFPKTFPKLQARKIPA